MFYLTNNNMPNVHPRSPSPTDASRKRGRIACIACRQAKVRCDLSTTPCSRCTKMRLDCSVDPGFKRINKRDKFNELEDNVQRLQSIVEKHQATEQNGATVESNTSTHGGDTTNHSSPAFGCQPSPSNNDPKPESKASGPSGRVRSISGPNYYSLGDVTISTAEVEQLFTIYFDKYHQFLPILDPEKNHTRYYEQSTVVFWSILAVAVRTHLQYATFLTNLTPALTTHLWSEIGSIMKLAVGDISEVQALLLNATWPLPSLHLWSDRSMTMSGMALTSSMHIGLHRPGFDGEYCREPPKLNNKLVTQRSAAWVAAYCLCVSIAIENGHEALVPSRDWLISNVCSHTPTIYVPQELRHCAIIAKHANDAFKFFTSMTDNPAAVAHEPSFFAHLGLFEKSLREVYETYSMDMSLANKLRSQGSILLTQSMYFLSDQTLDQSKQGVLRAYTTAVKLLTILISDDNTNDFLLHAPNAFLRIIVRASIVMLRTLFSSHGADLDRISGKNLFDTAVFFLRQMSVKLKEKDQPLRIAESLKVMWKHMDGEPAFRQQPPVLKLQSRLGATILYDSILYYRRAAMEAQEGRSAPTLKDLVQAVTPMSTIAVPNPTNGAPLSVSAENFTTPTFESFLDSDLSWMDSLIDPVQFSVT